jgi:hypothetical protein
MKMNQIFLTFLFCVGLFSLLNAQTLLPSTVQPTFHEIAPSIRVIDSAYPNPDEIAKDAIIVTKDLDNVKGGSYKFVGKTVTTADLRNEKGIDTKMVKEQPSIKSLDYKWKDAYGTPIKKLTIYCDSFYLNEMFWLPECDLTIWARVINFNSNIISTSALPWRKALTYDTQLESDNDNGQAGANGGNITINCNVILKKPALNSFISANGTQGESVFIPKVNVQLPKTKTGTLTIYKEHYCKDGYKDGPHTDVNLEYDYYVAASFKNHNDRAWPLSNIMCWSHLTYDDDLVFDNPYAETFDNPIRDTKANDRITFEYRNPILPGKGGDGGKINLNITNSISINYSYTAPSGNYLARTNNNDVNYGSFRGKTEKLSFKTHEYWSLHIEPTSGMGGGWDWSRYTSNIGIKVPIELSQQNFNTKITNMLAEAKEGKKAVYLIQPAEYFPHLEYLQARISILQKQFLVYYKKNQQERNVLDAEIMLLAAYLEKLNNNTSIDMNQRAEYASLYSQALDFKNFRYRSIDDFKNEAGYRPMFSLMSTMAYLKNNLKSDLKLYVLSDLMTTQENRTGEFLAKVPEMLDTLKSRNNSINRTLAQENNTYNDIGKKAEVCDKQIDSIRTELKAVEDKLVQQAKDDEKRMKIIKASLKVAALAASVIPYGQPVLGQVVGNGLNALANNLTDISDKPGDVAMSVMDNVDLSGVMQNLSQRSLQKLKPKKEQAVPFPLNQEEQYNYDLSQYNEKLAKRNATLTKLANGTKDVMLSYQKNGVTKSELDMQIAKLKETSIEYENVSRKLRIQSDKKAEIFAELTESLDRTLTIQAELLKNEASIFKLQTKATDANYNKDLADAFAEISAASLKRLKWLEYQLIKAYEYTTLTKYGGNMPCSSVLNEFYYRSKAHLKTNKQIDDLVNDTLAVAYQATQKSMGTSILKDSNIDKYKTDDDFSRRLIFATDNKTNVRATQLLAEVYTNGNFMIDLQKDMINEIISPDESNTRIKDIMLSKIETEGDFPKYSSYKIKLEVLDGGVLRDGKNLFLFRTGDNTGVAKFWTWDVIEENGKAKIMTSSESAPDEQPLVDFLIDPENPKAGKVSRFTLAPAWAKCRINIIPKSGHPMLKLSKLEFGLKCNRLELTTDTKQVVLDVKMEDAPYGTYFSCRRNNIETNFPTAYYEVLDKGTNVTLSLKEVEGDSKKFVKWQVYNINGILTDYATKEISIPIDGHKRVVAIFDEPNTTAKEIILYESPSTSSPILMTCRNLNKIVKTGEKISGFERVAYNGIQEAFIKQE